MAKHTHRLARLRLALDLDTVTGIAYEAEARRWCDARGLALIGHGFRARPDLAEGAPVPPRAELPR